MGSKWIFDFESDRSMTLTAWVATREAAFAWMGEVYTTGMVTDPASNPAAPTRYKVERFWSGQVENAYSNKDGE